MLLQKLKEQTNFTETENFAITHRSTLNPILDLFAMGGSYRNRSNEDCIRLFKEAFDSDPNYALKCLFYLRDVLEGQGERRFFKVCYEWLAQTHVVTAKEHLKYIPEFGRWDDLYCLINTPLENCMFDLMRQQFYSDLNAKPNEISLLAKWLKSCNASSAETRQLGERTAAAFNLSLKDYRKSLSILREKIKVLEKLMSAQRWNEIQFDKIPSKAGLIYKNAFSTKEETAERYNQFAQNKTTKVNAKTLYPYDVAHKALKSNYLPYGSAERLMIQKYWDNLPDYYEGKQENGLAVVDVSGSMYTRPLEVAISLGAYVADKSTGPFAGHFITFSERPNLIEFSGIDIVDKINNCAEEDWGFNTNLEAVFDLILNTAMDNHLPQSELPETLYIFSDQEYDGCIVNNEFDYPSRVRPLTLVESIDEHWKSYGYDMPKIVFWNLDARQKNIAALGDKFSYVSGFSPSMITAVLTGKTGLDLMLEKLDSDRYKKIGTRN